MTKRRHQTRRSEQPDGTLFFKAEYHGIAWLVIVAVEMLTGKVGIGQFIQDAYMVSNYGNIIVGILTIGIIGFILDRLMSVVESRLKTA